MADFLQAFESMIRNEGGYKLHSVEGDHGWRTKHCPDHWQSYLGMVLWLWRNPAAGFSWSVLAHDIATGEQFTLKDSGNGLAVDKGQGRYGWYFITSDRGAFSFRWCKKVASKVLSFEAGWLLDIYMKDRDAWHKHPKATFQFQPQIKSAA